MTNVNKFLDVIAGKLARFTDDQEVRELMLIRLYLRSKAIRTLRIPVMRSELIPPSTICLLEKSWGDLLLTMDLSNTDYCHPLDLLKTRE